jgi:predicted S18 family serine protease
MIKKLRKKYGIYFLLGFLTALGLVSIINNDNYYLNTPLKNYLTGETKFLVVTNFSKGLVGTIFVEVKKGNGKTLVNTSPFLETDTQKSAIIAREVAKKITNHDLRDRDIIFNFEITSSSIGGPSAGAAMTLALISALKNKKVNKDIAVTGTITQDGSIGRIGSIPEKAFAANNEGIKILLVPKGQGTFSYYEKEQIEEENVLLNMSYIPKKVDLKKYYSENFNMEIIEVESIEEIIGFSF